MNGGTNQSVTAYHTIVKRNDRKQGGKTTKLLLRGESGRILPAGRVNLIPIRIRQLTS